MSPQSYIFGWITEPGFQLFVLVLIVFLSPRRYLRDGLAVILIFLFLLMISPLPTFLMRSLEKGFIPLGEDSKDAVVVLAGGIGKYIPGEDQYLWGLQVSRAIEAVRLWKSSHSRYLVITGSTPPSPDPWSETETLKKFAREWSIPEDRILIEDQSSSTYEHTKNLKPLFQRYGIRNFYLVTSGFHIRRASAVFSAAGYEFTSYPVNRIGTIGGSYWFGLTQNLVYWRIALHEYAGLAQYWFLSRLH